jgi:hypothetical protein
MNIKSFLSKLWAIIRSLFNNFPVNLKSAVHTGVLITENIKQFTDSPLADVLTSIIPGNIDDKIKQFLREKIPILLINLKLAESCADTTDPQEITKCAVKVIHDLQGDIKSAVLHNLSVMITQLAADGELTWSDGVCVVEWYYRNKFKYKN